MISSSFGGMSGFNRSAGAGARFKIESNIAPDVSPRKGSVPVHISYNTAPNENRSVRASSPQAPEQRQKQIAKRRISSRSSLFHGTHIVPAILLISVIQFL